MVALQSTDKRCGGLPSSYPCAVLLSGWRSPGAAGRARLSSPVPPAVHGCLPVWLSVTRASSVPSSLTSQDLTSPAQLGFPAEAFPCCASCTMSLSCGRCPCAASPRLFLFYIYCHDAGEVQTDSVRCLLLVALWWAPA
eukprot:EG_transcript_18074